MGERETQGFTATCRVHLGLGRSLTLARVARHLFKRCRLVRAVLSWGMRQRRPVREGRRPCAIPPTLLPTPPHALRPVFLPALAPHLLFLGGVRGNPCGVTMLPGLLDAAGRSDPYGDRVRTPVLSPRAFYSLLFPVSLVSPQSLSFSCQCGRHFGFPPPTRFSFYFSNLQWDQQVVGGGSGR